jgi:hypothetical protein
MSRLPTLSSDYTRALEAVIHQWLDSSPPQGGCCVNIFTNKPQSVEVDFLDEPVGEKQYDFARQFALVVLPILEGIKKNEETSYRRVQAGQRDYLPVVRGTAYMLMIIGMVLTIAITIYGLTLAPPRFGNCTYLGIKNDAEGAYIANKWSPCHTLGFLALIIPVGLIALYAAVKMDGYVLVSDCVKSRHISLADLPQQGVDHSNLRILRKLMSVSEGEDRLRLEIQYKDILPMITYFKKVNKDYVALKDLVVKREQIDKRIEELQPLPPPYSPKEETPLFNESYDAGGAKRLQLNKTLSDYDQKINQLKGRLQAAYNNIKEYAFPALGAANLRAPRG